jgi:hypothetical protein
MKCWSLSIFVFLFVFTACGQVTPAVPEVTPVQEASSTPTSENTLAEFAIYRVTENVSAERMIESDVGDLRLDDTPFIAADEIVAYTWETHELTLTGAAYRRLSKLEGLALQAPGLPFVACVGDEPIYGGMLWTSLSSASFGGLLIDLYPAAQERPLSILAGYPSPDWFTGEDLRADPRIRQALEAAGKLQ